MIGIYKIKSRFNNKVYIGSSISLRERISEHKTDLIKNRHHNKHLQNHVNKYGIEDLDFIIELIISNNKFLRDIEQLFLNSYKWKNIFNISKNTKIGNNGSEKKVFMYNKYGTFLKEFKSISEASRAMYKNTNDMNNIRQCCSINNNRIICKNYRWSFKKYKRLKSKYVILDIKNNKKYYFIYQKDIMKFFNLNKGTATSFLKRYKSKLYKDNFKLSTENLPK